MTLLNEKYDYKSISRTNANGKRHYKTPTGEAVASVTTILDATKPKEKTESLHKWRERVGHENAKQITTEAANRGTRMHTHLEHFVQNGEMRERGSNPFSWASHEMAKTVIDQGLKNVDAIWGIEVGLYFPQIYAGTTDAVGIHAGDDSIIDYKQTNKPKKKEWIEDYYLQLVAYALAHNELFGTKIRKGVVMMCVKPTVDNQCNIIQPPQYQEFILDANNFDKYENLWWKRVEQYYMGLKSDK